MLLEVHPEYSLSIHTIYTYTYIIYFQNLKNIVREKGIKRDITFISGKFEKTGFQNVLKVKSLSKLKG